MNEIGKKRMALTEPSLRISNGAFLMSAFKFSAGWQSVTTACMDFDRKGTDTMAPTGTLEAVKYDRFSPTLERVSGMTVMMFMTYL